MAEALAVLGAVAAAAELAKEAASVVDFIKQVRDAPAIAHSQAEQIQDLIRISDQIRSNPALQVESIEFALKICIRRLEPLQEIVRSHDLKDSDKGVKKFQKSWTSFLKGKEVERLFVELERSKTSLAICMLEIDSTALKNVECKLDGLDGTVKEIAQKINGLDVKMASLALVENQPSQNVQSYLIEPRPPQEEAHWRKIQNTLYFPEMNQREEHVSSAHNETFEWIFKPEPEVEKNWDNFVTWLTDDQDIYWIAGKPGAGKSTLMKFIRFSRKTTAALTARENPLQPVLLSFFFWSAGSRLQKSLEGALRSLLFQALGHNLSLAPLILQSKNDLDHTSSGVLEGYTISWTEEKLIAALIKLLSQGSSILYLLFLDGLDECEGSQLRVLEIIMRISHLPRVKICVSSRSWSIIESRLTSYPHLQLQELTKNDILAYVANTLAKDKLTERLLSERPSVSSPAWLGNETLAESIVRRAEGIFLWVQLVIQDLSEAAWKRETVLELRKRLDDIPEELEDLMKSILHKKLDKHHRGEAKEIFQIIILESDVPTPILALAIDPELQNARVPDAIHTSAAYVHDRCNSIEERLPRRTAGFLEINYHSTSTDNFAHLYNRKVKFMHRSAYDMIKQCQGVPGWASFDGDSQQHAHNALFKAYVASLVANPQQDGPTVGFYTQPLHIEHFQSATRAASLLSVFSLSHKALFDASLEALRQRLSSTYASKSTAHACVILMTCFHHLDVYYETPGAHISTVIEDSLGFATYLGLYNYALFTLDQVSVKRSEKATYLLFIVMERMFDLIRWIFNSEVEFSWTAQLLPEFVRQLLLHGANADSLMTMRRYRVQFLGGGDLQTAQQVQNETTFTLFLRCLAWYRPNKDKKACSITASTMYQLSNLLLNKPINCDRTVIERAFRFCLELSGQETPNSAKLRSYLIVSLNMEISCSLLLKECYQKLGYPDSNILSTMASEQANQDCRVIELRSERHTDWISLDLSGKVSGHNETTCYTLSSEESEVFIKFHHLLCGLLCRTRIHTKTKECTELEDCILRILESRDPRARPAIQKVWAMSEEERGARATRVPDTSVNHRMEFENRDR